jgi:hypothetical protein
LLLNSRSIRLSIDLLKEKLFSTIHAFFGENGETREKNVGFFLFGFFHHADAASAVTGTGNVASVGGTIAGIVASVAGTVARIVARVVAGIVRRNIGSVNGHGGSSGSRRGVSVCSSGKNGNCAVNGGRKSDNSGTNGNTGKGISRTTSSSEENISKSRVTSGDGKSQNEGSSSVNGSGGRGNNNGSINRRSEGENESKDVGKTDHLLFTLGSPNDAFIVSLIPWQLLLVLVLVKDHGCNYIGIGIVFRN